MFDAIVIGGGAAGLTVSIGLSKFNKKVLLVDKKEFGGECTWAGCVPSKSFIELSHRVSAGDKKYPRENIFKEIDKIIKEVYSHENDESIKDYGIEIVHGVAKLLDKNRVMVNEVEYSGKNIVICTGGKTFIPPIPGLNSVKYLTNENFFHQNDIASSYTLIGGGVISLELAVPLARLGAKVVILEKSEIFLPNEDIEVGEFYQKHLKEEGVELKLGCSIENVREENGEVVVTTNFGEIESNRVFLSAGRLPDTDFLKDSALKVEFSNKGVTVNEYLQTNIDNIYAVGDVVGPYRFSHMCEYQGETVVRNILVPFFKKKVDYSSVPFTIFSRPEYARTGLTLKDAKTKYKENLRIFKAGRNDRSIITFEKDFSLVVYTVSDKIVGAYCIGNRAGEIISMLQVLKNNNMGLSTLTKGIYAYPTYGSVLRKLGKEAMVDKLTNNPLVKKLRSLGSKSTMMILGALVMSTTLLGEVKLEPCPDKPNCVISDVSDTDHFIESIKFSNRDKGAVKEMVLKAIGEKGGTVNKVDDEEKDKIFIEASFFSNIFKFEDVMTLIVNMEKGEIEVRSGALTGYSDLGVNRRRVESIRSMIN